METTTTFSQPLHILLCGHTGTGKSRLAASAARPENRQLIALFDSIDNATPYLQSGPYSWSTYAVDETRDVVMIGSRPSIIPTYLCYDKEDNLLRKLWHFGSSNVENPEGIEQWRVKMAKMHEEMNELKSAEGILLHPSFNQLIVDSFTLYETMTRRRARFYKEGPPSVKNRDDDQMWAYAVTDYMEDTCLFLRDFPRSVIAITHFAEGRKTGDRIVNLSGRMANNAPSYFGNVWFTYINEEGGYNVITVGAQGVPGINAKNTVNRETSCENDYATIVAQSLPIQWRKRV
jgi:hypothetical protein